MKVKRFIYASSSSVYGDSPDLPKTEKVIGNPLSPYAVSKRINELYADVFYKNYGLEVIGLRYFNIFGPRQSPSGAYAAAIPLFIFSVLNKTNPDIFGDGKQSRDFTFVENAVEANIKALFVNNNAALGKVFNVALGEKTTVNDLFQIICSIDGASIKPVYKDERKGDIKHSLADISMTKKIIGYEPCININEGLKITYNWFKEKYAVEKN